MQADVLNILPELIDVTVGIKSSKVCSSFRWFFLRISCRIRDVGPVGIEVTTAKYRTLLLDSTGLFEVSILGFFSGRPKRV